MPKPESYLVYQSLLLQKLTGGKRTYTEITAEQADAAVAEVESEIRALGPNPEDLDASYEGFVTRQKKPDLFLGLRPDTNTIGPDNESRYAYSQRCRTEVMKAVRQSVLQTAEWYNALIRSGAVTPDGNAMDVSSRWMFMLMKTDGTPESRRYNDSLAALCALGENAISRAQYLSLRIQDHEKFDHMSHEAASAAAEQDLQNAAEFIYREVNDRIEAHRDQMIRGKDAAIAIQTGDYTKFPGGIKEAYSVFHDPAVMLAMSGKDVLDFLHNKLHFERTEEELHSKILEWQDLTLPGNGMDSVAEQVSNPYFAIIDPAKCDYNVLSKEGLTVDDNTPDALAFSFIEGNLSRMAMELREMDAALQRFALNSDNQVKEARHGNYYVFSRDDRVAILKAGPMTDDRFVTLEDNVPGRYAFGGMRDRCRDLLTTCAGWSTTRRTSFEFEELRTRLTAVSQLQLGNHPTLEEAKAAALAMEELRAAAAAYLARKRVHHWGTKYETQRINFANDVLRFAKDRQLRIGCCVGHLRTEKLALAAERADGPNPAWRNDPRYAGMSALEHQYAAKRDQEEQLKRTEQEAAKRRQEEAERPMREALEKLHLEDGRISKKAFDGLLAQCGGEVLSPEEAAERIETFLTETTARFRAAAETARNGKLFPGGEAESAKAELEAFTLAKTLTAGYAIAELLSAEQLHLQQKLGPGEVAEAKDIPIRRLVSAGKLANLAELMAASTCFQRAYAPKLFDPTEVEELIAKRNGPGGRARGGLYAAGREFLENIELARQNPEPAAEAAPAEEPKQEIPAEPPKAEAPAGEEKREEPEPKQEAHAEPPKAEAPAEDKKQEAPAEEEKHEEQVEEEQVEEEQVEEEPPMEPDATKEEKNLYRTIEHMSMHVGEENDRQESALKKLDKVLADKREDLHPGASEAWLRKVSGEALALSTLRCMLLISKNQQLANIIDRVGYKTLAEQIQETQDFRNEARKVNLTDPENVNKAIDRHFGHDTAYALLDKVNALKLSELQRENYRLRHARKQPQRKPNGLQMK